MHKIAIANWMSRLHISTISKDLAVLLYTIGTNVSFDMANVIFQVIVSYAKAKTTVGGLPFLFLIHEVLTIQKDGLAENDDLEMPQKFLKISTKVYTSAHVQDVGNEEVEIDFDVPVADPIATSSFAAPLSIMTVMYSELVRIRQRRTKIAKQIKQLK